MKRGVSPLIAAVLLIVFVVTLLIVIFNLTRETVESGFEKGEEIFEGFSNCDEVKFFVENAECGRSDHENERRRNTDLLYMNIKNEKNVDFKDAFVVKFFYSGGGGEEVSSVLDDTRVNAYEVKTMGIYRPYVEGDFGKDYKEINSIEIVPRVKAGDEFKFCTDKKREIEVRNC
ncbi:hypothetical protein J4443_00710 [Candidatus Woesearchaeota archaeon]|nr:hypothetical protein [Candidatus Woesearchaeota archaeon]